MIKHLIKSFTDPKRMLYPHNLFVNFIVRSNYRQGRDPEWSCSLDLISTAFVHKTVNINIRVMEPEGLAGVEGTFEAIKLRPLMNNHVNDSIFVMPSRAREYIDGLEMGPVLMCVQITTEDTQGAFTSMYNLNTYFIKRNDKNVTS